MPYENARMFPAMKIWKLPDGKENMLSGLCNSGDYFAELKKDGYWYQFEKTADNSDYLFSRNISVTTKCLSEKSANVPHIISALSVLPKDTILIGEIYYPGKTSRNVTTVMGCLPELAIKRQENNPLHYYIHDIIYYDGIDLKNTGALNRYKILKEIFKKYNLSSDTIELADIVTENIQESAAAALANGEEGMVLKLKDAPYVPDKRPAWSTIKLKKIDYLDAICIGFCDATKEYTGKEIDTWSYWIAEGIDGEQVARSNAGGYNTNSNLAPDDKRFHDDGVWIPVTKGYYYGWKTSFEVGAYNDKGEMVKIGTVSSGLTDELREAFSKNPGDYLNKVVQLQCMEKDCKEHTLRHAFFKGFRDDKGAKDCTIDAIF